MINHSTFPYNNPQYLASQLQAQQMQLANERMQSQGTVFIPVHSDDEVLTAPVAPGNTVYFKHETEPFVYTKSMGLSQFEAPQVKKYRLIDEEMINTTSNNQPDKQMDSQPNYLIADDLKPILDDLSQCKEELDNLKAKMENDVIEPISKPAKANTTNAKEK